VSGNQLEFDRLELLQRAARGDFAVGDGRADPCEIQPVDSTLPKPLSVGQEQIWWFSELSPDEPVYNEAVTIKKTGPCDLVALRRAFNEIVRRHEIWRTTFEAGPDRRPVQVVHDYKPVPLPLDDLSAWPDATAEAVRRATADARLTFDLASGPLIRPRLIRIAADDHRLYLAMHHIIFDGVAIYRIIMPELIALYEAFSAGLPSPLPELEVQYSDYSVWQQQWVEGSAIEPELAFWKGRLAGAPPILDLPTDYPRPPTQRFRGGMIQMELPMALTRALKKLGLDAGASLFMVLGTAFAVLLHRYSGQDDVVFATVSDIRKRRQFEPMIGYFLTPTVLRSDLGGNPVFRDLLARFRDMSLEALAHEVPFERLVRELHPERDSSRNPIFQVLFSLEPPLPAVDPAWSLHQMDVEMGTAKFDLYLEQDERPEGNIIGRLVYNSDLFEKETIERMAKHWKALLSAIIAEPDRGVDEMPLIDPDEMIGRITTDVAVQTTTGTIHGMFEARVDAQPDAAAVSFGRRTLTYRELDSSANRLANRLVALGVGPGDLVAISADRSPELVAAVIAVMKAGAAYVPIDPDYPEERRKLMLADCTPRVLVTDRRHRSDVAGSDCAVLLIDSAGESLDTRPDVSVGPAGLAYVIYTSGSTGAPKGVLIEHGAAVNHLRWMADEYGLGGSDVVLQLPSMSFHPSVRDVFGTLTAGAKLVLLDEAEAKDPVEIASRIDREQVTCLLSLVPSLLRVLLVDERLHGLRGDGLRLVVTCGEALSAADAMALRLRFGCRVDNHFGPTECVMACTVHTVDDVDASRPMVPSGRPVAGATLMIVDAASNPVPPGVPGELWVGGPSLARGYLNRPELTAERFPTLSSGARVYRTGDRVRYRADGTLDFIGRVDDQVKLRGFRIELGEIESVLNRQPGVRESAAAIVNDRRAGPRLVAYIVGARGSQAASGDLRIALRSNLPDYMVPGVIMNVDSLPRTPSGKIDRRSLAVPSDGRDSRGDVFVAPRTSLEAALAEVWSKALGRTIGVQDEFFSSGGHSLLAVRVLAQVELAVGVRVPLASFLRDGLTVEGLAAVIQRSVPHPHSNLVVPIQTSGSRPPLFFIHPDEQTLVSLRNFVGELGPDQPLYGLLPERMGRKFDRDGSVERLAETLEAAVRELQPRGPYQLCGYSFGGLLVYEMASRLQGAGEDVSFLAILDCLTPAAYERWDRRWMSPGARLRRQVRRGPARAIAKGWEVARRRTAARRVTTVVGTTEDVAFDREGVIHLGMKWRPRPNSIALNLFASIETAQRAGNWTLGWEEVHAGPISSFRLEGNHFALVTGEHAAAAATELADRLRRTQAAARRDALSPV
jgi:amino acid adenylation domain-containing protein